MGNFEKSSEWVGQSVYKNSRGALQNAYVQREFQYAGGEIIIERSVEEPGITRASGSH